MKNGIPVCKQGVVEHSGAGGQVGAQGRITGEKRGIAL